LRLAFGPSSQATSDRKLSIGILRLFLLRFASLRFRAGSGTSLDDAFNSRNQGHCDALHSMAHPRNFYIVGMVGRRSCGANILCGTFTSWQ
jgi:hypothetical protein